MSLTRWTPGQKTESYNMVFPVNLKSALAFHASRDGVTYCLLSRGPDRVALFTDTVDGDLFDLFGAFALMSQAGPVAR